MREPGLLSDAVQNQPAECAARPGCRTEWVGWESGGGAEGGSTPGRKGQGAKLEQQPESGKEGSRAGSTLGGSSRLKSIGLGF